MRIARREGIWHVVWKDDGKWRRVSLRTADRGEAERNLALWLDERKSAAAPTLTVAEVWAYYWERHGKDRISHRSRATVWRNLAKFFGPLHWELVDETRCQDYHAKRLSEGVKSATAWSELRSLRTALAYAHKRGIITALPFVWCPPEPAPRDRRMTREQAAALIEATDAPHVRLFVILGLTTAGRMRAILDLTWDRVDFDRGIVHLRDHSQPKAGKGRASVPMNAYLRAALWEARQGATCEHVVEWGGHRVLDVSRGVKGAAKRIGLPWVSCHILRHTAATLMVEAGVPIEAVGQYLGHTSLAVTYKTYARFSPSALAGAAAALDFGAVKPASKKTA